MDHREATESAVVEKYLLDELSPQERDDFESHFFDCQECATDVQAGTAFMDAARKEFERRPLAESSIDKRKTGEPAQQVRFRWWPAIQVFALAASLLVIAYQNIVVYPALKTEIAQTQVPEVLPTLSLAGVNSRGGSAPAVNIKANHPFVLEVDIPTQDRFTSYDCSLMSPDGASLWSIEISSQAAKDTVTMIVPAGKRTSGNYSLVISGKTDHSAQAVEIARDHFDLAVQP